jgi:cell wall-associated NlpC family hydrolase
MSFAAAAIGLLGGSTAVAQTEPPNAWTGVAGSSAEVGADLALQALTLVGVPYRFGGEDPARGFDCSGLVRHVARSVLGLELPRTSEAIARVGRPVARDGLQGGDLVFFNTRGHRNSHVGVYIGEGRFVHAPTRNGLVRIEGIVDGYWRARFNGARRLHADTGPSAAGDRPPAPAPDTAKKRPTDEQPAPHPASGA